MGTNLNKCKKRNVLEDSGFFFYFFFVDFYEIVTFRLHHKEKWEEEESPGLHVIARQQIK